MFDFQAHIVRIIFQSTVAQKGLDYLDVIFSKENMIFENDELQNQPQKEKTSQKLKNRFKNFGTKVPDSAHDFKNNVSNAMDKASQKIQHSVWCGIKKIRQKNN